ncbi:MAG: cupin domain-containing protein [Candidatus Marinimicrobia bacterium]|nr:cupin domain-containing protein [Candidatus Neomarinimicrobiota bacterium]
MKGKHIESATAVAGPPGVTRRTLAHNRDVMLCHFHMRPGARIPPHNHTPSQIGFLVSGRVRFITGRHPEGFEVATGDSYLFDPGEQHQAEALEESEFVEVFHPARPEYE